MSSINPDILICGDLEQTLERYDLPPERKKNFANFYTYLKTLTKKEMKIFKDKVKKEFVKARILDYSQRELLCVMFSLYEEDYRV